MVGRLLDKNAEKEIVEAIRQAEFATSGEIRVHVKKGVTKDVMAAAKKIFLKNKMHLTRERNGIIIYISWKSREFAVFGDEGIYHAAGDFFWNETCHKMKEYFAKNELKEGIVEAVKFVGEKLKRHFPSRPDDLNELPDKITEEQ